MFELIPTNRFGSLGTLSREMNGLWDNLLGATTWPVRGEKEMFSPLVNVKDTREALELTAEVPGMNPEELDITLEGDVITIKGEKKEEREEKEDGYHLVERRYGSFRRSFRLPIEVDREKLEATHKNGVVKITLPKKAEEDKTAIKVKVN